MRPKLKLEVPAAPDHFAPEVGLQDDWPAFTQAYLDTLYTQAAQEFPGLDIEVRKTSGEVTSVRQNGRGEIEWETLDTVLDWLENSRGQNLEAAAKACATPDPQPPASTGMT